MRVYKYTILKADKFTDFRVETSSSIRRYIEKKKRFDAEERVHLKKSEK